MQTVQDMLERATAYLRQDGACTPGKLTALLYAVYNDGTRDMRDMAVVAVRKIETNAAAKRIENESGAAVQQGRRLAAEEIASAIGSISAMKEERRGA